MTSTNKDRPRADKDLGLVETRHSQRIRNQSQQAADRRFHQSLPKAGLYPSHFSPYLMRPDGMSSSIIGLSKEEVEEDLVTLKLMFQTYFVSEYYDEAGVSDQQVSLSAASRSVDVPHSSPCPRPHVPATSFQASMPPGGCARHIPSRQPQVNVPASKEDPAKGTHTIKRARFACVAPRNRKEEKAHFEAAIRASMVNSLRSTDP
ncbi:hypothetical protein GUITHDRAFT_104006 [Guillardia theta CCMP2712]|uniref:Uncharacterized protein n=1 Tax=Guillardia theta (strain CCMP2712) TaxID=905079 RepID=L1JPJ4_GUITC|nr:hypothetical protein GUITHDRAFT_104006 [Guillardia theta CCMP2712]EKX50194.1 hypothetical protein GUITHDRAFT_104006 [Guillardia theta CCMP2712]|mmetsp:Transcript_35835/g.112098  ORF Transcript_35835/g.112098 Transcript_35835/m.112098 type:complete len:205 (+) Transcript_35835:477-1091(+)|eukprot:XP_005837174.1 hypothetical protein GUITHDRAFT_104006 [Guillardia theta CCMP2712]